MNLKLNSWYVWLWNYTYSENVPNNLCPLFWKLVVAILLFIPNVIFRIPTVIINLFYSKYNKITEIRTGLGIFGYILIAVIIFVLFALYNYLLWLFGNYSYDSEAATCGGALLCAGLFFLIIYLWFKKDIGYVIEKTATDNIIVNYASSWYNKHCPKINWK